MSVLQKHKLHLLEMCCVSYNSSVNKTSFCFIRYVTFTTLATYCGGFMVFGDDLRWWNHGTMLLHIFIFTWYSKVLQRIWFKKWNEKEIKSGRAYSTCIWFHCNSLYNSKLCSLKREMQHGVVNLPSSSQIYLQL